MTPVLQDLFGRYLGPAGKLATPWLLSLLIVSPGAVAAQTEADEHGSPFSTRYSRAQSLQDLDELSRTLTETHPDPYAFTTLEAFSHLVDEKKAALGDPVSYPQLIWAASEIVAALGCSHTTLGFFNQEDRALPIELRFPMDLRWIDGRLYVADPLANADRLSAGTEVFSINGRDVRLLMEEVFSHISSQANNNSSRRHIFNAYATSMIPYALGFPSDFQVVVKGRRAPVELVGIESYQPKPRVDPDADCVANLCLKLLDEGRAAVLTVRSFAYYGDRFPTFEEFIDESFRTLDSQGVQSLVLDLRMNDGGAAYAGLHLLGYLAAEPFVYFAEEADYEELKEPQEPLAPGFRGDLYILIDGNGTSTTGHFMSLVKQMGLGTVVGEELGSNYVSTANSKRFELAHSGIGYRVASSTFLTTAQELGRTRGILPDHQVVQGIDDWLSGRDTVMQYALGLLRQARGARGGE